MTYALALMGSGFLITSFITIARTIVAIFNTHPILITLTNLIFCFVFLPGNFIVVYCLDKFGMRFCVPHRCLFDIVDFWFSINDLWFLAQNDYRVE